MAIQHQPIAYVPPPSDDQAAALQTVSEYLNHDGTQVASFLLGCPLLDDETAILAEFSTSMFRGAALCEGLLELTDEQQRR